MVVTRGAGGKKDKENKEVKYKVMEGNQTSNSKNTMEYTGVMVYSCILEIYMMLLTSVTPINLI